MPKIISEVPDELTEVGKAMAEHLARLKRTLTVFGGGKAVDYAALEEAIGEDGGKIEQAARRTILQSLDIDLPAVMIGGVKYTRVGRCEGHITRRRVRCRWNDRYTGNRESVGGSLAAELWMR